MDVDNPEDPFLQEGNGENPQNIEEDPQNIEEDPQNIGENPPNNGENLEDIVADIHEVFVQGLEHQNNMAAAAEKKMYSALKSTPKFDETQPYRIFEALWKNWKKLAWPTGSEAYISVDTRKRIFVQQIDGRALNRVTMYLEGTTAWADSDTLEKYEEVIRNVYAPESESDLTRAEYHARKQGKNETILVYAMAKISLRNSALKDNERSFQTLLDAVVDGIYNSTIKRIIIRNRPTTEEELINQLTQAVASERTCVLKGFGESPNLDGLALSSLASNRSFNSPSVQPTHDQFGDEFMDTSVGKMGGTEQRSCHRCGKKGHLRANCRVPEHKLPKHLQGKGKGKGPTNKGAAPKKADKSKIKCYNCGRNGHYSRECRQPRKPKVNAVGQEGAATASTEEGTARDPWAPHAGEDPQ